MRCFKCGRSSVFPRTKKRSEPLVRTATIPDSHFESVHLCLFRRGTDTLHRGMAVAPEGIWQTESDVFFFSRGAVLGVGVKTGSPVLLPRSEQ